MGVAVRTSYDRSHRATQRKSKRHSTVFLCALRGDALLADTLVRPDNSANIACSRRRWPRFLFLRFDHVEIFIGRSRIKQHYLVVGAEEAAGSQLLIGNERRGPFGRGEYALLAGPVSHRGKDFFVS